MSDPVCITGATGFIGSHIVDAFLTAGLPVRAAVRSPDDPAKTAHLRAMAQAHGVSLSFHAADLDRPGSYDAALEGCAGLVHVAASVRLTAPDPQRDIVDPSVEGTRHVLQSATRAGVQRVVLTSSTSAISTYAQTEKSPGTEADWTQGATVRTDPYGLAKTQAERLAWSLAEDAPWRLVTCNPALVLGPVFTRAHCDASPTMVRDILTRAFPANPRMGFGVVHVRDVAAAHLAAYQRPDAQGRHVLCSGALWLQEMAKLLAETWPDRGIRTAKLPNFVMWLVSLFDERVDAAMLRAMLGRKPNYDGSHAPGALGFTYTSPEQAVRDTAASMLEQGFVG